MGFLYGDTWRCWHIQDRTKADGTITEVLKEMPQDWVPFRVYSQEDHAVTLVKEDSQQLELQIPGWSLLFQKAQEPPAQLQNPLDQEPLQQSSKECKMEGNAPTNSSKGQRMQVHSSSLHSQRLARPEVSGSQRHQVRQQGHLQRQGGLQGRPQQQDPSSNRVSKVQVAPSRKDVRVDIPFLQRQERYE